MKKIVLLFLLATLLVAQNSNDTFSKKNVPLKTPKVYSALGDVVYNNVDKIVKLKDIKTYYSYELKINNYASDVEKAKKLGFDIQSGYKLKEKKNYLDKLRELSKTNDFFVRSVEKTLKSSMANENNELFSKIVNSGLINKKKHKREILKYYFAHSADIEASGLNTKLFRRRCKVKKTPKVRND